MFYEKFPKQTFKYMKLHSYYYKDLRGQAPSDPIVVHTMKPKEEQRRWYKRIYAPRNIFFVACFVFLIASASADDVQVWQGQYYTGTNFNIGTYEFNFSVYNSSTGGSICYTNITNLTTGNFGEWKTEQNGVGVLCSNSSENYFLEIKINNEMQGERRRLLIWDYLRKDAGGVVEAPVTFSDYVLGLSELRIGTSVIHHHVNLSGTARHIFHNVNDGLSTLTTYSLENDAGYLLTLALTSSNYFSVPNNISFANQPSLGQSTFNDMYFVNGKYTGFKWFTNPNNDTSNVISNLMILDRVGNLNATGNMTSDYFVGDGSYLTGIEKEIFFQAVPSDANLGDFRTQSVASGAIWRFNFYAPSDFSSLKSLEVILIPAGTNTAAPVDLFYDCGSVGEAYNSNSGTLSTTWNLSTANRIHSMNVSGVFSDLGAGDFCGIQIDEGAFGFASNYLGIRLKYET